LAYSGGQQVFSPYAAMGNSPGMMIDPSGEMFNPFVENTIMEQQSEMDQSIRNEKGSRKTFFGLNALNTLMSAGGGGGNMMGTVHSGANAVLALGKSMMKVFNGLRSLFDRSESQSSNSYAQNSIDPIGTVLKGSGGEDGYKKRFWHYSTDYTRDGLITEQTNARFESGEWKEDKVGTALASAAGGVLSWWVAGGWGLSQGAEAIIAAASAGVGLTNIVYETREILYVVDQTTWFGSFEHNIFTGEIVNVNTKKVEKRATSLSEYKILEERIIFQPTGEVIGTRRNYIYESSKHEHIKNSTPKKGLKIY